MADKKIANTKFRLVDCCSDNPLLGDLCYGTMVLYNSHLYYKVDKRKLGVGISLVAERGHSILFNPIYGTLRQVDGGERLPVLEFCENVHEVYIVPPDKIKKYMRS